MKRREFILNGNMLKVILLISLPLIFYNFFTYVYGLIDYIVVANMEGDDVKEAVSSITMIGHITGLFTAIGSGMASACGILISRLIGKNNYQKAKTVANTLVISAFGVSAVLIAVLLPLSGVILRLCGLTENLINLGIGYFSVQVFIVALNIINIMFFSLEKARGATKNILYLNLVVISLKIALTLLFANLGYGTTMVAVATLIANAVITAYAVFRWLSKNYIFKFHAKDTMFKAELLRPYLSLAVPVFLGRFVFSLGKVIVGSAGNHYGERAPGALGISNHMSGSVTTVCNTFEETTSAIISQNIGAGNFKRVTKAFWNTLGISLAVSVVGVVLLWIFNDAFVGLFTKNNASYHKMISDIFLYERFAIIPLAVASSVMGLVYGLGYNKLAMIVNLSRLFVFRVPVIYILIYLFPQIGHEALGIAMMVSNTGIGIMSIGIAIYCLQKIRNNTLKDIVKI